MKSMSDKRNSLAFELTEKLDEIERESGIFLIKPLFSYQTP
jgi:hypothetical protein